MAEELESIESANAGLQDLPSIETVNKELSGKKPSSLEDYSAKIPESVPLVGGFKPSLVGMAKGLYNAVTSGATLPHDVYQGKVDPLSEEGIKRASELATLAGPLSPRIGTSAVAKGVPTIEELKSAARAGYESPTVKAVEMKADVGPRLATEIQTNLNKEGIDDILAPKTFGILNKLKDVPEDAFLSVDNLRTLRRTLNRAAGSADATERLAAKTSIAHLDETLAELPAADVIKGDPKAAAAILKEANGNYAAAMRAMDLDKRSLRAELQAARANSGMNVANRVRSNMADILMSPKLARGFNPEELATMDTIVRGYTGENFLRHMGNILGGGGGLLSALYGLAAIGTHGGAAIAPVAGYGLRKLSNSLALRHARKLNEAVRLRSPLGAGVEMPKPSLLEPAVRLGLPAIEGQSGFKKGGRVTKSFVHDIGHSKKSVDYSKGMPSAHCSICRFYDNGTCAKVRGYIKPDFWCRLFSKK